MMAYFEDEGGGGGGGGGEEYGFRRDLLRIRFSTFARY
jgi:hypothetical protein